MRNKGIVDNIKKKGAKVVVLEVVKHLEGSHDANAQEFARDLYDAVRRHDKREQGKNA
jgi:CHASE2 domain-containing sensor protein